MSLCWGWKRSRRRQEIRQTGGVRTVYGANIWILLDGWNWPVSACLKKTTLSVKRAVTFIHSPGKVLHDAPNDDDNDIKEFSRNFVRFCWFLRRICASQNRTKFPDWSLHPHPRLKLTGSILGSLSFVEILPTIQPANKQTGDKLYCWSGFHTSALR